MESVYGGHTVTQAIRIMQLFEDFECDYIVLDTQNIGLGVYDQICQGVFDKDRGKEFEVISCMNDEKMAERCIDDNARKVLFSIKASAQLNSDAASSLKDKMQRGKVRLLIDNNEAKDVMYKLRGFESLGAEKMAKLLAPFVQTDALINEMVNLEKIPTENNLIKLKEPRSARKDRYTSVSYGNYFADILERSLMTKKGDVDIKDYFIVGTSLKIRS